MITLILNAFLSSFFFFLLLFFLFEPSPLGFCAKSCTVWINILEYRTLHSFRIYTEILFWKVKWVPNVFFTATCEDPGKPENGWRVGINFGNGSVVTFGCNSSSYVLVGASNITCNEGKWSGKTPSCEGWSKNWMMANTCYIHQKKMSIQKQITIQLRGKSSTFLQIWQKLLEAMSTRRKRRPTLKINWCAVSNFVAAFWTISHWKFWQTISNMCGNWQVFYPSIVN